MRKFSKRKGYIIMIVEVGEDQRRLRYYGGITVYFALIRNAG